MKEGFSVRPLNPQDEHFLWEMLYHAIYVPEGHEAPPRSILEEPKLAHYVSQWGQRSGDLGLVAVIQDTDQPVGAAWLRLFSRRNPGYGFVDDHTPELSIAVLPDYRRQGLGSLLLTTLLEASRQKFAAVSLSVSSDNPARRLYQRLGFIVVNDDGSSWVMLRTSKEFPLPEHNC